MGREFVSVFTEEKVLGVVYRRSRLVAVGGLFVLVSVLFFWEGRRVRGLEEVGGRFG